jgi:hypothetical protein
MINNKRQENLLRDLESMPGVRYVIEEHLTQPQYSWNDEARNLPLKSHKRKGNKRENLIDVGFNLSKLKKQLKD